MFNDLRFALRMIAAHRWFSLAVIVTLALGIGINTTVFTLVNVVLFKPVPIPGGERIVTVCDQLPDGPERRSGMSWPDFLSYKAQNRAFDGLEALANSEDVISENGIPPERARAAKVSTGLFGLIKTPPRARRSRSSRADSRRKTGPVPTRSAAASAGSPTTSPARG